MKQELISLLNKLNKVHNNQLIKVDVNDYVNKILTKSSIITIKEGDILKAFIAYYKNDLQEQNAYLTMLAVDTQYQKQGLGSELLMQSIKDLKESGFKYYTLEVLNTNQKAIEFYKKNNFVEMKIRDVFLIMEKEL